MSKRYLIDSNCFITAKNSYYPFDFAPSFWIQLEEHLKSGDIILHKAVLQEVTKGEDDLSEWIRKIKIHTILKLQDAMSEYATVMRHIQECSYYNDQGVRAWADLSIADPQLIASALKERDLVIVTVEQPTGKGNTRKKTNPKIPDVAKDLGVETMDLFRMMRELGFRL